MAAELTQKKIKRALKHILKRQNYTYADVAKVWECSLPTVKRQLGAEELPLSRLLILLEWLNLSLGDLYKLSDSEDLDRLRYTDRQNQFLADNPREFSFLMKLYGGLSPEQIGKKYKLSTQVVEKILIRLEKYDLIRVGRGGEVKPFYSKVPVLEGALAKAHAHRVIERAAYFHKHKISEKLSIKSNQGVSSHGSLHWLCEEVSEKSYQEYSSRLGQLMSDLLATSKIESKSLKKSNLKIAVVNLGMFLCEQNDPNLHYMTEAMDVGLLPDVGG